MQRLIVISGSVGSGKSTLAERLRDRLSATVVSTRELISESRGAGSDRAALQLGGDALDARTGGGWVADGVASRLAAQSPDAVVVIDAVRKLEQVEAMRARWPGGVHHVHLLADGQELERRHEARMREGLENASYAATKAQATEAAVDGLAGAADVVVDTADLDRDSVVAKALASTPFRPRQVARLVDVVVGAQYGSEGKGNLCASLAGDYDVLLRVGGPNAGHVVHEPRHTFRQLPSGAIANPAAKLLIGAGATLSVEILFKEIGQLAALGVVVDPARLSIDPRCIIIEQSDIDYEQRTLDVIASTKQGVGVATARKILGRSGGADLGAVVRLAKHVPELEPFRRNVDWELERAYAAGSRIMLEGTQGTGLSLHHGDWPNVTSRDTTTAGCLAEAGIAPARVNRVFMVTRTYPIRVGGDSGDFDGGTTDWDVVAARSGLSVEELRAKEQGSVSHTQRRVGWFSWEQVRRAAVLNGATDIALTFADYLDAANRHATSFDELTSRTLSFIADLEAVVGIPVTRVVKGERVGDVLKRRA